MIEEVVVEVEGQEQNYHSKSCFVCDACGQSYASPSDVENGSCHRCEEHSSFHVVKLVGLCPRWMMTGDGPHPELLSQSKYETRVLEKLQEEGWELIEKVDGYGHLTKPGSAYNSGGSNDE